MKKRVMNIRPQEVTTDGERSVQYKGSDGRMHDFSAKLPQDAAIPVVQRTVIAAGEEITLAQAHAIEGFDFNKVSALNFTGGYDPMTAIFVNYDPELTERMLEMEVSGGASQIKYKIVDDLYVAYSGTGMNRMFEDTSTGYTLNKSRLKTMLLKIAQQTGKLEIGLKPVSITAGTPLESVYEDVVLLTLAEDILASEEFFMPKASGGLVKLATVSEEEDDGQSAEESFPYSIQNNPNAFELITGPVIGGGTQTYKARRCDGSDSEITASELYQRLLRDPYTVVIYNDTRPGSSGICTAILHIAQHDESTMCVRLNGELVGNTKATYKVYVYATPDEGRITISKTTS